jgi:hypothetical protein
MSMVNRPVIQIVIAVFSLCLLRAECIVAPGGSGVKSVKDLRLNADRISNWNELNGSYKEYTAGTMNSIVDGFYTEYTSRGIIEGTIQQLSKNECQVETQPMDFGTAEIAQKMFEWYKGRVSSPEKIGDFPLDKAFAERVDSGKLRVRACFDKYYFEMNFTVYSDLQIAIGDANIFLRTYNFMIQ